MASLTRAVPQLSREQLELANVLERTKHNLKKEGFALKKRINEIIFKIVRNLCIFLTCHIFACRINLPDAERPDTFSFWVASLVWIALWCFLTFNTYQMICSKIKAMDRLLERDELLKLNVDIFIRNIRDSFMIHRVTGKFIGGPAVALQVKVSPHIVDHGVCLSQLAVLKQFVEEPLVASSYKFTYWLLVVALSSFGIVFAIGWTVIVDYGLEGDERLRTNYLFRPT